MGRLITITGVSGAGKTTFAQRLGEITGLPVFSEQHNERPFHTNAAKGVSVLANQIDYLMYRSEQEWDIRRLENGGIIDGGMETDYHIFTSLFHQRELLTRPEFNLCARFFTLIRSLLPPPEVVICLNAPLEVAAYRYQLRNRKVEIARMDDLTLQQSLLDRWLGNEEVSRIIRIDASTDDILYTKAIEQVLGSLDQPGK